MQTLELSDVERIVHLVAEAGDPTVEMTLPQRKRLLMEGLAKLVDADVWMWSTSVPNPAVHGDVMTTYMVDGGWKDDAQKVRVYECLSDPTFAPPAQQYLVDTALKQEYRTFLRGEVIPDEDWVKLGKIWQSTGLAHMLLNVYPLTSRVYSSTV